MTMKCTDDNEPLTETYKPRGKAGVAIIWKKSMSTSVIPLPDGGTRVQAIQTSTADGPITLINTYLPSSGSQNSDDTYEETLDEVHEIYEKYSGSSTVLWAGDLNGSFNRQQPSNNDTKLRDFCKERNLYSKLAETNTATYHHFVGNITSQIDHIVQARNQRDLVESIQVDSDNHHNVGSHDGVIATLRTNAVITPQPTTACNNRQNWDRVNIEKYEMLTKQRLSALIRLSGLELPTDVLVNRLNDILVTCAKESDTRKTTKNTRKRKRILEWQDQMKPAIQRIKELIWKWKQEGKSPNSYLTPEINEAKKALRSLQRQKSAIRRTTNQKEMARAHEGNKTLFYKLIRKQREIKSYGITDIDFEDDNDNQQEGWALYFEQLANPLPKPEYDEDYKTSRDLVFHLLKSQEQMTSNPPTTTAQQTLKHIRSLKTGKAGDLKGIVAEHLLYASEEINQIITAITNKILYNNRIPNAFRCGKVVPVLKKNKPAKDPNSYRRITVNSIVGKVTEKELVRLAKPPLSASQHPLQFGFTDHCSPANGALLITEAILEAKEQGKDLYIIMMDARKAFDIVWQESALVDMHQQGVQGSVWLTFTDMYKEVSSRICINGELSRCITETAGIRQGAVSSTEVFKARTNPVLEQLSSQADAMHIGSVRIAAPTCADDVCLLSDSHLGAQSLLSIAQMDANRKRYDFNEKKTKIVHINSPGNIQRPLLLNGKPVDYSQQETHLGIQRNSDGAARTTIIERIKAARRTCYALLGAGVYTLGSLSPEVTVPIIRSYIAPVLLYGLDVLCLTPIEYGPLETFYKRVLRQILHLPTTTAIPALYLLTGCLPVEALHHLSTLSLFGRIARRIGSIERELAFRQLAMKDPNSNSWFSNIRRILYKYKLPPAIEILHSPPTKENWKKKYTEAISLEWESQLKRNASTMKSLMYLDMSGCNIGVVHPVWRCGSDPMQARMASVQAKLLVQRYPLASSHCAGKHQSPSCPVCLGPSEDISHFLFHCQGLQQARQSNMRVVDKLRRDHNLSESDMTPIILDPSLLTDIATTTEESQLLATATRRLCFRLHCERSRTIGSAQYLRQY